MVSSYGMECRLLAMRNMEWSDEIIRKSMLICRLMFHDVDKSFQSSKLFLLPFSFGVSQELIVHLKGTKLVGDCTNDKVSMIRERTYLRPSNEVANTDLE